MDDERIEESVALDQVERHHPADRRAQGRQRLRDHRRRAPLARLAARRPPQGPGRRPRHPRGTAARGRADREHPARGSQSDRGSDGLPPARRRVLTDAGADRRCGRQGSLVDRQLRAPAQACRRKCATTSRPGRCRWATPARCSALPDEAAQLRVGKDVVDRASLGARDRSAGQAHDRSAAGEARDRRRTCTRAPPEERCASRSARASASSARARADAIEIDFGDENELHRLYEQLTRKGGNETD